MCCPVGFFEDYNAVFHWKYLKLTPKPTNRIFQFSKILCIFVSFEVPADFVYWNVFKGQQGIFGCPVVFYEEIIALLWMEMPQIDTEIDKNLKSSNC